MAETKFSGTTPRTKLRELDAREVFGKSSIFDDTETIEFSSDYLVFPLGVSTESLDIQQKFNFFSGIQVAGELRPSLADSYEFVDFGEVIPYDDTAAAISSNQTRLGQPIENYFKQSIKTDQAFGPVGDERIADVDDVMPTPQFLGNTLAVVISGSILDGSRQITANRINRSGSLYYPSGSGDPVTLDDKLRIGSVLRGYQAFSQERYYDSIMPDITELAAVDNEKLTTTTIGTETFNVLTLEDYPVPATTQNWRASFPFEKKYKNVKRNENLVYTTLSGSSRRTIVAQSGSTMGQVNLLPSPLGITAASDFNDYLSKSVFGIGDEGVLNLPSAFVKDLVLLEWRYIKCRGWKYGVMNGSPQFSKIIFRRDRYGQFRDILEQRLDGKFSISRNVMDGPVKVKFVSGKDILKDPVQTKICSNIDIEAASILPFFDGQAKNR